MPIVSVSLGDDAEFAVGGFERRGPTTRVTLRSGDVFVLGGPSRLRFHGITRVRAGTGPAALRLPGRVNLTFRRTVPADPPAAETRT